MGTIRNIALGALGIVVIGAGVVAVRTAAYTPPAAAGLSGIKLAPARAVDTAKAARDLSQAVQFNTVTHQDPAEDQPAEWDRLHAFLQSAYPAAHAAMTRAVVGAHTLIYTWAGSDPSLPPIILMAHQDVVPVTPGTEANWKHPPFSGAIAEGAVWGRGSVDDKGTLITLFESLDSLAAAGFKPKRTIILVSGEDEEVRGQGARAAAAHLKAKGIKALFVLDEGLAVIADNPVTKKPAALVGIAEKGYATLQIVAPAPGGHSSTPPKETGVTTLSRAVLAVTGRPFPLRFSGPGADMLRALAPEAPPAVKMAVANAWLFGPLLTSQFAATPPGAAMLHTTIAPTMLKGSPKENVLPQDATAWINYRIAPGDTSADVMARAQGAVGKLPVKLSWLRAPEEPSPVSSTSSPGWKYIAALAADETHAPIAPSLVVGGTDSRYLAGVADDVYRFAPTWMSLNETEMIHGTNEHMSLENLTRMVRFYERLIETACG
jgi:carboxypeptidase PM20D1